MRKSAAEVLFEKGFAIGLEEGRIMGKTTVIQYYLIKDIAKIVEQGIAIGIEQDLAKDIDKVIEQAKAVGIEQDLAKDTDKTIEQSIVMGIEQGIAKVIEQAKVEIYRAWHADWEKRRQAVAKKGLPFNDSPPPNPNNNN